MAEVIADGDGVALDDFDAEDMDWLLRDDHLRQQALAAANIYAMHRVDQTSPFDVVERAQAFYRFLNGEHAGTVQ